jgi:glycosyltransferase involved in cell wall biosynthesis
VRFLGHRSDIDRLMAAADIYCQPNTEPEPFGVALVEAMWAGRPVVTTDAGGLAHEIAGGDRSPTGLVLAAHDEPALVSALRELVLSADLRARLGAEGPATARRLCDPSRQLRELATLFSPAASVTGIRT